MLNYQRVCANLAMGYHLATSFYLPSDRVYKVGLVARELWDIEGAGFSDWLANKGPNGNPTCLYEKTMCGFPVPIKHCHKRCSIDVIRLVLS